MFQVTKIFGVNYDLETTRRLDLETHMSQYTPTAPTHFPRHPPAASILSSQSAILANNMESASSSTQHINILALARSRNGLEHGEVMSHTSTIDSLELFATIRENCVLVPSYSEALLLSSLQMSTGDIPAAVKDVINNLSDAHNSPQRNSSHRENLPAVLSNISETNNSELENVIHKCLVKSLKPTQHLSQNSLPSTSSAIDITSNEDQGEHTEPITTQPAVEVGIAEQVCKNSADQSTKTSAIIDSNTNTPKRIIRIMEEFNVTDNVRMARVIEMDDSADAVATNETERGSENKYSPFGMHTTQSNYSLRTGNNNSIFTRKENNNVLDKSKAQNRRSWAGFLSKPNPPFGHYNRVYGSARIRPIPRLNSRRNSHADSLNKNSDETLILTESVEEQAFFENGDAANANSEITTEETDIPIAQIEAIDRNLGDRGTAEAVNRNLFFSSPLLDVCPIDPLGGREQTTPTEDPPPYEVAINLPVMRRITRSITDRGELFGQSRAFINDTLLNRRSCADNVISGTDSVRLLQNTAILEPENAEMETNL